MYAVYIWFWPTLTLMHLACNQKGDIKSWEFIRIHHVDVFVMYTVFVKNMYLLKGYLHASTYVNTFAASSIARSAQVHIQCKHICCCPIARSA